MLVEDSNEDLAVLELPLCCNGVEVELNESSSKKMEICELMKDDASS